MRRWSMPCAARLDADVVLDTGTGTGMALKLIADALLPADLRAVESSASMRMGADGARAPFVPAAPRPQGACRDIIGISWLDGSEPTRRLWRRSSQHATDTPQRMHCQTRDTLLITSSAKAPAAAARCPAARATLRQARLSPPHPDACRAARGNRRGVHASRRSEGIATRMASQPGGSDHQPCLKRSPERVTGSARRRQHVRAGAAGLGQPSCRIRRRGTSSPRPIGLLPLPIFLAPRLDLCGAARGNRGRDVERRLRCFRSRDRRRGVSRPGFTGLLPRERARRPRASACRQ
ncbi:hypothetical protein FHT09_001998 [Xanthomonas arboricola]|nr:hypothetical protein [Xanthomonas sp. CFBP 8152]